MKPVKLQRSLVKPYRVFARCSGLWGVNMCEEYGKIWATNCFKRENWATYGKNGSWTENNLFILFHISSSEIVLVTKSLISDARRHIACSHWAPVEPLLSRVEPCWAMFRHVEATAHVEPRLCRQAEIAFTPLHTQSAINSPHSHWFWEVCVCVWVCLFVCVFRGLSTLMKHNPQRELHHVHHSDPSSAWRSDSTEMCLNVRRLDNAWFVSPYDASETFLVSYSFRRSPPLDLSNPPGTSTWSWSFAQEVSSLTASLMPVALQRPGQQGCGAHVKDIVCGFKALLGSQAEVALKLQKIQFQDPITTPGSGSNSHAADHPCGVLHASEQCHAHSLCRAV